MLDSPTYRPVYKALHRPLTVCGVDRRLFFLALLAAAATFNLVSSLVAGLLLLWVWLSRVWTEWRPALVLVQPATVLAWHRRGFRLFWTWKSRRRTGRPTVSPLM